MCVLVGGQHSFEVNYIRRGEFTLIVVVITPLLIAGLVLPLFLFKKTLEKVKES